ncbi:hypothetical protein IWQ56_004316 [Coemansia nantahalensis]|nr:hypothetical protein IWQ56_004316 [Coemansia nantahalensis]
MQSAPPPPPPPGPPVERHPYNDDWGTTLVAILLMSLIVFAVFGILIQRSFRLVPTGVLALGALVGRRSDGAHRLDDDSDGEFEREQSEDAARIAVPAIAPAESAQEQQQQRLELVSEDDDAPDVALQMG